MHRRIAAIACILIPQLGLAAASHATSVEDDLAAVFERFHADGNFDGAVLVAKDGKVIYQDAYGLRNVDENQPNQVQTPFRIASITKGLTTVLVLQAAERDEIELDEKVSTYLSELKGSAAENVTIDQLLNHTSGIVDFGPTLQDGESLKAAICRELGSAQLASSPGEKHAYCNVGFTLLGCMLEVVTGKTYTELLEERIFIPAGMSDTYVGTVEADAFRERAQGYRRENDKLLPDEEKQLERFVAAGGVVSTARDMLAFSEALRKDRLLSATSCKKMLSSTDGHRYGCRNIAIPTGDRIQVFQGGMSGTSAFVVRVNDGEYTVVALENLSGVPGEPLMREVIELLLRSK